MAERYMEVQANFSHLLFSNKKSPWSEQGQWREFLGIIKTDNAVVGMYICSEPLTLTGGSVKSRGEKLRQELPCRRQI